MSFINKIVNKITGADKAAKAAKKANEQASAAEQAAAAKQEALMREQWDYQKQQTAPWIQSGLSGLAGYEALLKNPSSATQNPGYQFRLDQGLEGVTNSAAASGGLLSGNTLKGLTEYGQNFASNEYSNALNRYATLANYGSGALGSNLSGSQNFSTGLGNVIGTSGQNLSNMYMNQGQIAANKATSGFNSMLDIANIGMSAFDMFGPTKKGGGGGTKKGGGGGSMDTSFFTPHASDIDIRF